MQGKSIHIDSNYFPEYYALNGYRNIPGDMVFVKHGDFKGPGIVDSAHNNGEGNLYNIKCLDYNLQPTGEYRMDKPEDAVNKINKLMIRFPLLLRFL
jgi:hypothetical protein